MQRLSRLLFVAALLVVTTVAYAGDEVEWKHPCGFKFTLPEKWKTDEHDGVFSATDPDEKVELIFVLFSGCEDVDHAVKLIDKEIGKVVKHLKVGEVEKEDVNGISAAFVDGVGDVEGEKVELGVACYDSGDDVLMVYGVAPEGTFEEMEETLLKILHSVKKD